MFLSSCTNVPMYFVNDNGLVKLNHVIYEPHHQKICSLVVRGHKKKLVNILKLPFQEEAILYEPMRTTKAQIRLHISAFVVRC